MDDLKAQVSRLRTNDDEQLPESLEEQSQNTEEQPRNSDEPVKSA